MNDIEDSYGERSPLLGQRRYQWFFFSKLILVFRQRHSKSFLSHISRFSKRTYAASSQNLVKIISGVSGSQCVTEDEFEAIYTISWVFFSLSIILELCFRAFESVIHLMKGYIGIGIFVLPFAFIYSGLVGGLVGVLFSMLISIHCANILSAASQKIIVIK